MAGEAGREPEPREGEEGPASAGVMMVVGFMAASMPTAPRRFRASGVSSRYSSPRQAGTRRDAVMEAQQEKNESK
jgi:hypothetical protein